MGQGMLGFGFVFLSLKIMIDAMTAAPGERAVPAGVHRPYGHAA